jgi:transcription termination factor NusB
MQKNECSGHWRTFQLFNVQIATKKAKYTFTAVILFYKHRMEHSIFDFKSNFTSLKKSTEKKKEKMENKVTPYFSNFSCS